MYIINHKINFEKPFLQLLFGEMVKYLLEIQME